MSSSKTFFCQIYIRFFFLDIERLGTGYMPSLSSSSKPSAGPARRTTPSGRIHYTPPAQHLQAAYTIHHLKATQQHLKAAGTARRTTP